METTFKNYISSRRGLCDLCETYGKSNKTVEEAVNDMPNRMFWMGGNMIVATDDSLLEEIYDMMYDR